MVISMNPQYLAGTARHCILTESELIIDGMHAKVGKKVDPFSKEYAQAITGFALAKILDKCSGVDIILEEWFVRNLRNKWVTAVPAILKHALLLRMGGTSSDVFNMVQMLVDETIRNTHHVEGYMTQQRVNKLFERGTYNNVCDSDFRHIHKWLCENVDFDEADLALLILTRPFTGNRCSNLGKTAFMDDHLAFEGLLREPPKGHWQGRRAHLQGDRLFTFLFKQSD